MDNYLEDYMKHERELISEAVSKAVHETIKKIDAPIVVVERLTVNVYYASGGGASVQVSH